MSVACPKGHESEWADYCSICGDPLGGKGPEATSSASPSAPVSPDPAASNAGPPDAACSNCGESHGPDDVFCENCGFDFGSQTLPEAKPVAPAAPASAVVVPVVAVVTVDRDYYESTIGSTDLVFPDPVPAPVEVPLVGAKALIGRHSQSRGIFPEIDVAAITADPAVSSRHAMLEHDDDGNWSVDDLGSTNGTLVGDVTGDAIPAGDLVAVPLSTPVYVGAWTRIEIQRQDAV